LSVVSWLMRGLLGLGGAALVYLAWPVAQGAWFVQEADAALARLREGGPLNPSETQAAIASLDQAIRENPSAQNHLYRSELLAGAATGLKPAPPDDQREKWLSVAERDLEVGLAGAPAHGIAWLRAAVIRQILAGPSAKVAGLLLMSIETAAIVPRLWPLRLELIFQNWDSFTDAEREQVARYVAMTWRASVDRRWFIPLVRNPRDELYLRILLADLPEAQEELSTWIGLTRR
jgi:hypothetical protein